MCGGFTQGCAALHPGLSPGHPVGVTEAEVWAGAMWSMALWVIGWGHSPIVALKNLATKKVDTGGDVRGHFTDWGGRDAEVPECLALVVCPRKVSRHPRPNERPGLFSAWSNAVLNSGRLGLARKAVDYRHDGVCLVGLTLKL